MAVQVWTQKEADSDEAGNDSEQKKEGDLKRRLDTLFCNQLLDQACQELTANQAAVQKRENLKFLLGYLHDVIESKTHLNPEHKKALQAYVLDLNKKVNPANRLEKLRYKRVPDTELSDMIELTVYLTYTAKHIPNDESNSPAKLPDSVYGPADALANKIFSCSGYFKMVGALALVVLGAALIVGAGCMAAATYGTASPFALGVAKFGFGITSLAASYIFAELMLAWAPALYRKICTKEKAIQSSTKTAMKELGVVAGAGLGGGSGVAAAASVGYGSLPATASITSTVFPSVLPTATTSLGVTGVLTGIATTAFAGLMAMGRGLTFFDNELLARRLSKNAGIALNQTRNVEVDQQAADSVGPSSLTGYNKWL